MKVGLIHYSYPPTVGGVEFVVQGQARAFAKHGHKVRVISKNRLRPASEKNIEKLVISGKKPSLKPRLRQMIKGMDLVIVHNVMSMPFDLSLTAAIWELATETRKKTRWIFWTHDLCVLNPDYPRYDTSRLPFSLLKSRHPSARYVTISEFRRQQLSGLLKIPRSQIQVVPDGIDVPALLDLDPAVWNFFLREKLHERDHVLFLPTRVLPRKNLEDAIELIASLKAQGKMPTLIITGAHDPHNASSALYLRKIRGLIQKRKLRKEVIFVHVLIAIGFRQLLSLYRLCDAVLMTSREEGFGLPLLEAGIHSKPVICPRRPPFTEIIGKQAIFLGKQGVGAKKISWALNRSSTAAHFKRVLRDYSWEAVWEKHLTKIV